MGDIRHDGFICGCKEVGFYQTLRPDQSLTMHSLSLDRIIVGFWFVYDGAMLVTCSLQVLHIIYYYFDLHSMIMMNFKFLEIMFFEITCPY
jgi:hypothetical protein